MSGIRDLLARLLALVDGRRLDCRLDEEIASHIELATDDNVARGMTLQQARLEAIRQFGGIARAREAHREVCGFAALDTLCQDLRYAFRSYRHSPAFTVIALATLALAIGANAAVFSLLNALVLRDLPVRDPQTLVQITTATRSTRDSFLTFPMFRAMARDQRVFSAVMAEWRGGVDHVEIDGARGSGLLWGVTGNVFSELGISPAAGRAIDTGDLSIDPPAAGTVVMLGHTFWSRYFHRDVSAIGRTIRIGGAPFTIVGIAPAGFGGFGLAAEADVIIPITASPIPAGRTPAALSASVSPSIRMVGRLRPDVTLEQARAQLTTLWPAVRQGAMPADYTGARRDDFLARELSVASGAKGDEAGLRTRYTRPLAIVMTIAAVILLIACVNLASLMLSRASARSHEIAVRVALGASRRRVAQQMLVEGVVLSIGGAACGVAAAYWACRAIAAVIFEEYTVTVAFDATPDARVVAAAAVTAVAVGVLFSVIPAARGTRQSSTEALQKQPRTATSTGRTGRRLVGAQIALTLVLIATAGLLVRTLVALRAIPSGVDRTARVLVAYSGEARPHAFDGLDNDSYYPQLLQRVEALPGVRRASASLLKPGTGGGFDELVAPIGEAAMLARGLASTRTPVAPGFFDVVGIPLLQGRDLAWTDHSRARPVAIVSESLARRLFGARAAVGERLRVGLQRQEMEVIGVAADARLYDVKNANVYALYTAALQDPSVNFKCLVVAGADVSYAALKRAVEDLGRERMGNIVTLRYISDRALLQERLTAMLAAFFSGLALLLSAIGLYGLMSYAVAQRRRELGIRVALGADRARLMREVVQEGLSVTLAGAGAGLVCALAAVQVVRSLLFGVAPHDPLTLVAAPLLLVAVAVVACAVPAARAARVDPMEALRAE